MLARTLRVAQLAELAACLAAGAWLHAAHGWGTLAIAAGTVAWFAGVRLALALSSNLVAWLLRTPRAPQDRIGVGAALRLVLREWAALVAANLWYLPWERIALRPDPPLARTGRVPVILLHGYYANRGYLTPLVRALEAHGVGPIFVPTFTSVLAPIEDFAEELHRHVERIAAATGQMRVAVIAHSMGGLVARAYVARHGAQRIACLVTLGTPHHGSLLAWLGMGRNGREMRPGSAFLARLASADGAVRPHTTSVCSPHDNMVVPQASARLEGARNVAIPGLGHIAMLRSPRLAAAVLEALERCGVR